MNFLFCPCYKFLGQKSEAVCQLKMIFQLSVSLLYHLHVIAFLALWRLNCAIKLGLYLIHLARGFRL